MSNTVQWLLRSEPYVRYRTLMDLMNQQPDESSVLQARSQMLSSPLVQGLLSDLETWPGETITNHKKAGLLYHKLAFLADIGIRADDSFMKPVVDKILDHISEQGVLELPSRIPVAFGGTGEDIDAWILCDTPRLYASLLKMGVLYERLKPGVDRPDSPDTRQRISLRGFAENRPVPRPRQAKRSMPVCHAFDAFRAAASEGCRSSRAAHRSAVPADAMGTKPGTVSLSVSDGYRLPKAKSSVYMV